LNYPDDFNTRTFPAGKSIAISRAMGVGIVSAFLIIVCLCGLLIWTIRSVRVEPYVIATGGANDKWRVVMAGNGTPTIKMTDAQLFQQSLLWRFTQNWFNISPNSDSNAAVWNTECTRENCLKDDTGTRNCAIFCAVGDELFYRFSKDTLPQHQLFESTGVTRLVVPESLRIDPVGDVSVRGGTWRISATIILNGGNGAMDIVAYATIARNEKYFPAARGYYIAEFDAYRVSQ